MTYSVDFRQKVLAIRKQEKLSYAEAAKRFGVNAASIFRWTLRLEPQPTHNKPATKVNMEALKHDVEQNPDAYQHERAKLLGVHRSTIGFALKRLNISLKKNAVAPKSK
jgi:transposase